MLAQGERLPADWISHPFLRDISAEYLSVLKACAMMTEFQPGQVIFREGEIANRFYVILRGRVAIEQNSPGLVPKAIDFAADGEVLGWSWLFPPYEVHFTARVVAATEAVFFYGTWLRQRCEENPALGYELAKRVASVATRRLEALLSQPFRNDADSL